MSNSSGTTCRTPIREDSSGLTLVEPVVAETDRFGFILGNGHSVGIEGPSPELVRHRETKWINIISEWDRILKKRSSKVKEQCQKGIPASLRAKCWPLLCGATGQMQHEKDLYLSLDSKPALQSWVDVIERDLDRQFPFHEMFLSRDGHGQRGLFRVLKAYTQYQPDEGYCQAQGPVAAVLLMNMPAEEAFWCLVQISQQYLPGYYSPLLEGVLFDAAMLTWVLKRACPAAHRHLQLHGVEPLMFATDWLMCLFTRHLPFNTLVRVWDLFFCYGVRVLFQVAVVLVRQALGRAEQREECQGQMETLEKLRGIRDQVQQGDDAFIAEVCSVPLSGRELEKQTEKELQKWQSDRPSSNFDPRGRCHGYREAWSRLRKKEEERDQRERQRSNLSISLIRSASTLSLSPSRLRKRFGRKGKADPGEQKGDSSESLRRDSCLDSSPERTHSVLEEESSITDVHPQPSEVLESRAKASDEEKTTQGAEPVAQDTKEHGLGHSFSSHNQGDGSGHSGGAPDKEQPRESSTSQGHRSNQAEMETREAIEPLVSECVNGDVIEQAQVETETPKDTESHREAEIGKDTVTKAEAEKRIEIVTEVEIGTDTVAKADIKIETVTKAKAKLGIETVTKVEGDKRIEPVAEADRAACTVAEADIDRETVNKADAEIETEAVTKAEADIGIETMTKAEAEIRIEVVAKAEADIRIETVIKSEAKIGTKTMSGAETVIETVTKTEAKIGAYTVADTETEADASTETETEVEAEVERHTETEVDVGTETETEVDAGTETETEVDAGTENETEADVGAETETGVEAEVERDTETGADVGSETETEVDVGTGTETKVEVNTEKQHRELGFMGNVEIQVHTDIKTLTKMREDTNVETEWDLRRKSEPEETAHVTSKILQDRELSAHEERQQEVAANTQTLRDRGPHSKSDPDPATGEGESKSGDCACTNPQVYISVDAVIELQTLAPTEMEIAVHSDPENTTDTKKEPEIVSAGGHKTEAGVEKHRPEERENSDITSALQTEPERHRDDVDYSKMEEAATGTTAEAQTNTELIDLVPTALASHTVHSGESRSSHAPEKTVSDPELQNMCSEKESRRSEECEDVSLPQLSQDLSDIPAVPSCEPHKVDLPDRNPRSQKENTHLPPDTKAECGNLTSKLIVSQVLPNKTPSVHEVARSNTSASDFRVRKSSSSRATGTRRLSEDLFTAPSLLQSTDQSKCAKEQRPPENSPAEYRPADIPKRFGLFRRLRGEQPKPVKVQVPKILIQDFSDGVGRGRTVKVDEEGEFKVSSRERRRRRREQERKEKEEEKLQKKKEKEVEKERERERRKIQTRGKSFQVQTEKSNANIASSGKSGSQALHSKRHSVPYAESYF